MKLLQKRSGPLLDPYFDLVPPASGQYTVNINTGVAGWFVGVAKIADGTKQSL